MPKGERHGASFRDPSGFVFSHGGVIYRQVNQCYKEDYGRLFDSGLYADLTSGGLLLEHEETGSPAPEPGAVYKVLKPTPIPFVSYPYEWPFSALKNAALATLAIQRKALEHEMVLKDASAYNMQFIGTKVVFIDIPSIVRTPCRNVWIALDQFYRMFLYPLLLARCGRTSLKEYFLSNIDGMEPAEVYRRFGFLGALGASLLDLWLPLHRHCPSDPPARHAIARL